MAELVADVVLARLREWGVRQFPGTSVDPLRGLTAGAGRCVRCAVLQQISRGNR